MKIAAARATSAGVADIVRVIFLPRVERVQLETATQTDIAARTILRSVWLHYHLHTAILFVAGRSGQRRRAVERHAMRDDEGRIDLSRFDVAQQARQVLMDVRLTRLDRQGLVHRGAKGGLVEGAAGGPRGR